MTPATRFSFDPAEFAGKRALVTGGTKGMGEAIVVRLVAGGARVATTARSPVPDGQTVELFVQADITAPEGVAKVANELLDRFGGVDILIDNVGGSKNGAARLKSNAVFRSWPIRGRSCRRNLEALPVHAEGITRISLTGLNSELGPTVRCVDSSGYKRIYSCVM